MDEKYLSAGRPDYLYHIVDGYAVSLSPDKTVVLYSRTNESEGVYSKDGPVDEEIAKSYYNLLSGPVLFDPTKKLTIKHLINSILDSVRKHSDTFVPIMDLPKTNKVVMDGLDKALELMAFREDGNSIQFVAFGTRLPIVIFLSERGRYVSPAKFYSASAFKGNKVGRFFKYGLIIASENLDNVGVILGVDPQKRDEARNAVQSAPAEEL